MRETWRPMTRLGWLEETRDSEAELGDDGRVMAESWDDPRHRGVHGTLYNARPECLSPELVPI